MSNPRPVDPVAIVGIGCRFPGGVTDARSFWSLLLERRSSIVDVPADRWNVDRFYHPNPAAVGTMVMRRGGFVDNIAMFDAAFWGISPREAVRMDPQQRWLLEAAWEAIENAGTAPSRLRGGRIGVFVGISSNDYGGLQLRSPEDIDAYTNSGSTASIAANRVSYLLDLRGPSVSVDTACSSSLVAVAAACESLWSGGCDGALAGGVNALISPQTSVGFSKAAMISPSGDCFAFDARANGFVRAEGVGLVYLKPLTVALADGDRIYALIRAAVVNQDGHTSSMTVPGLDGQTAMLEEAYRQAGILPARVAYVEAHGTGTPVGDPIEAAALGAVLGRDRPLGSRCLIGSVKTNIGHLESGSGIAGLIKAALVLHHRTVPATLNYERPNPSIPFDDLRLEVITDTRPLPDGDGRPPVVGVNSFGFGGTNAHAVLEAAPAVDDATPGRATVSPTRAERPYLLPVSARDESALRAYVQKYRDWLADVSLPLADLCASAGDRKEAHAHRLVIIGRSREELRRRAAAWLHDGSADGVIAGRRGTSGPPVFVFAGQGPQWWAMGRQLLEREPIFRDVMRDVDEHVQRLAGWSLLTEMCRPEDESRIDHTDITQPAIFAVQAGLIALWKSWGVHAAKAIGHSVGEAAAAYCAGVYSLEDAVRIALTRGRLQHRAFGRGRMLAVAVSESEARAAIGTSTGVELAAINSPRLMTLAGDVESLERIERELQRSGIFTRWLRGHYAFHSAQMDPVRAEVLEALRDLVPRREQLPLISTVTGAPISGESLDAAYWWQNIRQPVRFGPGLTSLIDAGDRAFLEISPHPVLESAVKECLADQGHNGAVYHSLRREVDESDELAANLAGLYLAGTGVDWTTVNQGSGRVVAHPSYPWNRERFWIESDDSARLRLAPVVHPLLGQRIEAARPTWQVRLDLNRHAYLKDHRVWDTVVFPAAAYLELGLALGRTLFAGEPHAVEQLQIRKALFLVEGEAVIVQIVFNDEDKSFAVYGAAQGGGPWELHAQGVLTRLPGVESAPVDVEALSAGLKYHLDHEAYCRELAARGYQFGPAFRQVRHSWRRDTEVLVAIEPPHDVTDSVAGYVFHPAMLDACFHAFLALPLAGPGRTLYLPESVRRLHLYGEITSSRLWAHAVGIVVDGSFVEGDIRVFNGRGERVADVLGFRIKAVEQKTQANPINDCYYQFAWEPRRLRGSGVHGECDFAGNAEIARAVTAALPDVESRHGLADYRAFVHAAEPLASRLVEHAFVVLGWRPEVGERLDFNSLFESLGVAPDYHRVTRRLLQHLERTGVLCSIGPETWRVSRLPESFDAGLAFDQLAQQYPSCAAETEVYRRTGLKLAEVLTGDIDPLELMFPAGSHELMERFYTEALGFPAHLELTRRAVETAIAALPPRRVLRVLEVGAGTGVLTRTVLPALPAHRTEYTFTDIGTAFVAAARKRFTGTRFIDFQVFDLEMAPERQQIPTGEFDLVLGADVVHATSDLRTALGHLRQALAPGGLLLLLELAKPDFLRDDISFGLLRGYSRFRDTDLRPHSALATASVWRQTLVECGFADVQTVACSTDPRAAEHVLILGSAPGALTERAGGRQAQPSHFVLVADRGGTADQLATELTARGHTATVVSGPDDHEQTLRAIAEGAASGALAGVIHCKSLDTPGGSTLTADELCRAQTHGLGSAFELIRATADRDTRTWFITRGAQPVSASDTVDGLATSPLIGLVRVANNEHRCRFRTIDLDGCPPDTAATLVADEVTLPSDDEFEIAYRDDVRHVLRLQRVDSERLQPRTFNAVRANGSVAPFRLETRGAGILANLGLHETGRTGPAPHEVEVRVRAAGINFRDVLKALGTHPGQPPDLLWFGDDLSGIVERVGEFVTDLRPGDEVAGIAGYAFQSYARTDPRLLFRKPAHLSFAQVAAIPTVFLTAEYAINRLARMQSGESILIHAAAGGVGLAAIQVARHRSLEIFATAGTPEKRSLLADMGIRHVMSSRTLEFADEVMRATAGRGVDAVLNSLAGDFIPKSLSVLAPFGRFLEIGKVDVYRNARIGLQSLRNNGSYFVIDLTQHIRDRRDDVVQVFAEIAERFAAGDYRPIPLTAFPVTEAVDAFRFMAQGKHVGKNVLTFDHDVIPVALPTDSAQRFKPDATYLITGGAGGFGLEVARWIAQHGGRHLALMSRTGPRDAAAQAVIDELRAGGASVLDVRGDVTDSEEVRDVIDRIGGEQPPLKGVFHAAMVLDDDLIVELDEQRLWKALMPKMAGAWNLHAGTAGLPLDHFVCFSSFSSVVGLLRQGNYNAGNAFLDALAHHRRARGLPALTINWGAIRGAGFVERDRKTSDVLTKLGFGFFQKDEALRVLDDLLVRDAAQVVAARAEWNAALKLSPLVAASTTYAALVRETHAADRARSLDAQLRAATAEEQERLLTQFIVGQVAGVFGTAEDTIDRDARLTDLGLDSLMTLELTNRVEREIGIRLPAGSLLSGPTIVELARSLRQLLAPALSTPDAVTPDAAAGPQSDARGTEPAGRSSVPVETRSSWRNRPSDHLVVIKPGDDVPVFCFHPLGGGVGIYGGLSPHVPDDLPLIGVESRLARGAVAEYGTLSEMTDAYVEAVRSAHGGPYRLFGFSLGGYLAARVAELFRTTGHEVEFVGIIDWDAQQKVTLAAQREALVRLSMASYLFLQAEMAILRARPERWLEDEISVLVDQVTSDVSAGGDTFFRWVVEHDLAASPSLVELAHQYLGRFEQHCRLIARGLPRPDVGAPLIVWRASRGFGSGLESWGRRDGLAREHVFAGDHNALMRPAALRRVAEQMMDFIQRCAAVGTDGPVNAVELT
jgi:acyl transferase domain-containing protein/NADPH:quinone reductase-like Zn-dependent oxidoreductase/thioesterase domain-containing protein/acyl carrier protein